MKEDTAVRILDKLEKQEKAEGGLPLLLEFYRELVRLQAGAQERIKFPLIVPDREDIRKRLGERLPLLNGIDSLNLDWPLVQEVYSQVRGLFAGYPQLFGESAVRLKETSALTREAVGAWFTGKDLPPAVLECVGENLMLAVIQATLQPFLAGYSRAVTDRIEQGLWRRGYCPVCGGAPDLAFLKGDAGARWLLCSRCDTEWLFQRLECPYCGTQEQDALGFLTDDREVYRLYFCERCKCYLKAIDLRRVEGDVLLPLERLYTLDLDAQAVQRGYHPRLYRR